MFTHNEIHNNLKETLKLTAESFRTGYADEIITNLDGTTANLVRLVHDRMTLTVYIEGLYVFSSTFYFNSNLGTPKTEIMMNRKGDDILYSTSSASTDSVKIGLVVSLRDQPRCTFPYPIPEDEYFQQLTLYPLPAVEEIDTFIRISEYVLKDSTVIGSYSLSANKDVSIYDYDKIHLAVQQLVNKELKRINDEQHISST